MNVSRLGRWLTGLVGFGLISSACGSSSNTPKAGSPTVCDPGAQRCDGRDIKRCDALGASETIDTSCSGQCRVQGNTASCAAPSCTANAAMCDGNIATTCQVDGSGPQPGGLDCADTHRYCVRGACHDTPCIGGTKTCQSGDVYLCASDGSSQSLIEHCTGGELCSDESGTCVAARCLPGNDICSGTRVLTCNERGDDWLSEGTDCAAAGKVCIAGRCEAKICAPSTTFCQEGNLYRCDSSGVSTLAQVCRPGFDHCEVTSAGPKCVADACLAGYKLCVGNVVKTCNADGSLPAEGTACGQDEFCENAQCKPGCAFGTLYCQGNAVYSCGPMGPSVASECSPEAPCRAIVPHAAQGGPGLVDCAPLHCAPGERGCVQNQIGTCASNGTSLSAVTEDCAASGKICSATGTCAASVTDTLGLDEHSLALPASPYVGNLIDVRSSRKLVELQMMLVFTSPRDLRWLVFEQVDGELLARAETTTTTTKSTGFVSSGPLSYQLEAGKHYALGVLVPPDSITYNSTTAVDGNPSFATILGSVTSYDDLSSFSIAPSFDSNATAYMKVMTEAP